MGNRHSKHLDIEKGDDIVEPKAANSQPKCENIPLAEFSVYREQKGEWAQEFVVVALGICHTAVKQVRVIAVAKEESALVVVVRKDKDWH